MHDVTTIFTVYKRNSLGEQIDRMDAQTVSSNYFVWQNENYVDVSPLRDKFYHVHSVNYNWKFHGRFALPLMSTTKYTVILDDDTLPNPKWLESCIELCEKENCIVGGNGRTLNLNNLTNPGVVDEPNKDHEVDFVGHAWFFKTDWIRAFWSEPVVSHYTAEDISFCAALKVNLGIKSFVPDFTIEEQRGDSDKWKYGTDHNVNRDPQHIYKHISERAKVTQYWINKGWKPCS